MRYNTINEAIIKVPPELINKVNLYVSSYLYYKISTFIKNIDFMVPRNTSEEEKEKYLSDAKTTLAKLHAKYKAKNISSATANNIFNNSIDLKINPEIFFSELNFKGTNSELINSIKDKIKVELLITDNTNASGQHETDEKYKSRIVIDVSRLSHNPSFLSTANAIMSTAYHESQHAVQSIAIKNINPESDQLSTKKEYSKGEADYFTSGVEYTPQLGNLVDAVYNELEKDALQNKLNPNKNEAIKDALYKVIQGPSNARRFLQHLYKIEHDKYIKAMKEVYIKISPEYDELKKNGIDYSYTDIEPEELEANINVMTSVYKMLKPLDSTYTIEARGYSVSDINSIKCKSNDYKWIIYFDKVNKNDFYSCRLISDNGYQQMEKFNSLQVLNLTGILKSMRYLESEDVLENMEYLSTSSPKASKEEIKNTIDSVTNFCELAGLRHTETESTITFAGITFTIEVSGAKTVSVESDNEKFYMILSLKQLFVLFQEFISSYIESSNKAQEVLYNSALSFTQMITALKEV